MFYTRLKRLILGEPLSNQLVDETGISKWKGLGVLSSSALSSVAYASEEILIPLVLVSAGAMAWSLPVALGIVLLLWIVAASHRQVIQAYPGGGGAYLVAKENLGTLPGLIAGAALLVEHILTVSVSVAAAMAALDSAFPELLDRRIELGIGMIVLLMLLNLRGVTEFRWLFAIPTYTFLIAVFTLIGTGVWTLVFSPEVPFDSISPLIAENYPTVSVLLLLRAFSSGSITLSGIETISSGVGAFRFPQEKNAKTTLIWTASFLTPVFLGITFLAQSYSIFPTIDETVLSKLGRLFLGEGYLYYFLQISTVLVLVVAANTVYTAFPVAASHLAKDRYLPRQLASVGDKLVFSNGIIGLSFLAAALLFLFDADPHNLVPLYAVGVFVTFSLSQFGMVFYHLKEKRKEKPRPGWARGLVMNLLGGLTASGVLLVVVYTEFVHGAWMMLVFLPITVFLFTRIHAHYLAVGRELSLIGKTAPPKLLPMKHTVIVPVSGVHRGVVEALRYAISISSDVRAAYVEFDSAATERFKAEWTKWANEIPVVVLKSPYRSVIRPLLEYIDDVEETTHGDMITVLIPEFVTAKWWHQVMHNQTAFMIRTALIFRRGKVVTSVRYHLGKS